MNDLFGNKRTGNVVIWLLLLTMPYWLGWIGGYTSLGSRVLVLALAAMSLNFLLGFTGVLSFGHAAYFGLGAYGAGMTHQVPGPEHAARHPGRSAGRHGRGLRDRRVDRQAARRVLRHGDDRLRPGVLLHRLPLELGDRRRRRAFAAGHARRFTSAATRSISCNDDKALYYLVLACFAVAVAIMAALLRSPFGRTLLAIRENERRARFLGIPVERHIWLSFVISCLFVSLAGALYALLNNFADPHDLHWSQSGDFVIMAVLGGMRSFWGPLIGAAIFVVLQDYLSSLTENWQSFIGLFFVLVVLFFPRGVLGMIRRRTGGVSLLQGRKRLPPFRQPGRGERRVDERRAGRAARGDRAERRRQDHLLQSHQRLFPADLRPHRVRRRGHHARCFRRDACGAGMARTFQVTEIFPELTVRENLRIPVEGAAGYRLRPWLSRDADGEVRARVSELMEMGGLTEKADRLVGELSHGDQRAAEIMMSLALKPRLLLLDEPTAGMGDQETYDITRLIRRLHRDQTLTIVLIEHDMRVVFHLADRIMVLAEGSVLAEGTPAEIGANERVQAAYLGKAA